MAKYLSVIIGGVVAILGLVGLVAWKGAFVTMLKGAVPAILLFGGVIAVIAGISEIKDEAASTKEEKKSDSGK